MELTVTGRAQELIAAQGGIITVKVEKRLVRGCSNPKLADTAFASMGKPNQDKLAEYQDFLVDGVTVFAHDAVLGLGDITLRVDVETTLFEKRLVVYGLPVHSSECGGCTSCN